MCRLPGAMQPERGDAKPCRGVFPPHRGRAPAAGARWLCCCGARPGAPERGTCWHRDRTESLPENERLFPLIPAGSGQVKDPLIPTHPGSNPAHSPSLRGSSSHPATDSCRDDQCDADETSPGLPLSSSWLTVNRTLPLLN